MVEESGSHPMKLRATETPSATPTAVVPPKVTAAATARTSASTLPPEVAVIVTEPTLFELVPSEPPWR